MDKHLRTVRKQLKILYSSSIPPSVKPRNIIPQTIKNAQEIERQMNEKIQIHKELENDEDDEAEEKNGDGSEKISFDVKVERKKFFGGMSPDQKKAKEFFLKKILKEKLATRN